MVAPIDRYDIKIDYLDKENTPFFQVSLVEHGYTQKHSSFEVFSKPKDFIGLALDVANCFQSFGMRKAYDITFSESANKVLDDKNKQLLEKIVWLKNM